MADSHVRDGTPGTPHCPFALVQILWIVGLLRAFPESAGKETDEIREWLSLYVHKLTGLSCTDIAAAMDRLVEGGALDGTLSRQVALGLLRARQGPRRDLSHVLAPLRGLDRDGETAKIWHMMYNRWPIIRTFFSLHFGEGRTVYEELRSNGVAVSTAWPVKLLTDDVVIPPAEGRGGKIATSDGAAASEAPAGEQQVLNERQLKEPPKEPSLRLALDPQTQTVTLDDVAHKVDDPKAFAVYQEIVKACPQPVTRATICSHVRGVRGNKKVRLLINSLPHRLKESVKSGTNGYWLDLSEPRPRKKGRT
jgi:hypothetical protein